MPVLDRPIDLTSGRVALSLAEYLDLPGETRAEIVDGVLRPMTRESHRNRTVQLMLAMALRAQVPDWALVFLEEIVVLIEDPALSRIPDVVVRSTTGYSATANNTPARDVLLAVEIVSPGTRSADLREKPVEYALAGISSFWLVQFDPDITVTVHRLVSDDYEVARVFGRGEIVRDATLPWVAIEVTPLLDHHA